MSPSSVRRSRLSEGLPYPLGATWDGLGVNFALFSANATKVELCLFDDGGRARARAHRPAGIHRRGLARLPARCPARARSTAIACTAPTSRAAGHRFNPNKLLLDPYAKQIDRPHEWNPALFGYQLETGDDLTFDERDSAPYAMKASVIDTAFTWGNGAAARRRGRTPIIYETHVRGFTKRHPALPEELRGTYAGLASAEIIDYLRSLGVSAVELLPIHTFVDDSYLLDKGLKNYWGYNTIGFFAPARRYAANADFAFAEFKEMVAHLHDAGLEVILDVVYNHTAEGNELGPDPVLQGHRQRLATTGWRPSRGYYINDTGTGNTVNLSNRRVLQMVMDSLRYWANDMRVDGFRFDLATILGARAARLRRGRPLPRRLPAGPGAQPGQADRRALGHRPRRLPGRPLLAGLGGMERPLSATPCGPTGAATRASCPSLRRGSPPRPTCSPSAAASPGPSSTSWRRMTASR